MPKTKRRHVRITKTDVHMESFVMNEDPDGPSFYLQAHQRHGVESDFFGVADAGRIIIAQLESNLQSVPTGHVTDASPDGLHDQTVGENERRVRARPIADGGRRQVATEIG